MDKAVECMAYPSLPEIGMESELWDSSDNTASVNSPEDSQDTSALARAQQETLTLYKSAPSLQQKVSVCRASDTGYFAADVGASGFGGTEAVEGISSSEDENSDGDPPGDEVGPPVGVDPPDDEVGPPVGVDPPDDEVGPPVGVDPSAEDIKEPSPSSKPTTCEDDNVTPGADTLFPEDLLAEDTVQSDKKEPRAEREVETHPHNKQSQTSAVEARKHFSASDQPSPANCKGQEADISCNEKVEPAELLNEGKTEADDEGEEGTHERKTQAEDAEDSRASRKDKPEVKGNTGASQPKRGTVLGLSSVPHVVGATAQKQHGTSPADTFHGQTKCERLSTVTPESDSRKNNAEVASPPEAGEQAAADLPSASIPCSTHVGANNVRELSPVLPWRWVEDAQDQCNIENHIAEIAVEDQLVQMLMVHMEPHDHDLHPPPHPCPSPHLPLPIQESEQGRRGPAQLALPDT